MNCKICSIANNKIINAVEELLIKNQGAYDKRALTALSKAHSEFEAQINAIDEQACKMHFNFHQKMTRSRLTTSDLETKEGKASLSEDIGKDEAAVLSELLAAQSATFTALTNQVNKALIDPEYDMSAMLIHPETISLYKLTAESIRLTVKELRELNLAQNGQKDGAMEGLKALATALRGPFSISPADDGTTKEFDI